MDYIDGNEFEQTILCQDRHDDFVARFRIVIKKRKAASVSLDEYFGCIVESTIGMILEHRRGGNAEALLDFWREGIGAWLIGWARGDVPRNDSSRNVSTSAAAAS